MKLSDHILEILNNFKGINTALVIPEGNQFHTQMNNRALVATARMEDESQQEFAIFDLGSFLQYAKMCGKDSEVTIGQDKMSIKGATTTVDMPLYDKEIVVSEEVRPANPPGNVFAEIKITKEILQQISMACNIGTEKADTVTFKSDGIKQYIEVSSSTNPTTNVVRIDLVDENLVGHEYEVNFSSEYFRMIPQPYKMSIFHVNMNGQDLFIGQFTSNHLDYTMMAQKEGNHIS